MLESMREFKVNMDAPIRRESTTAKILLIRHGLSMHNFKSLQADKLHGKDSAEKQALEKDPRMVDPDLHPLGTL